MESGRHGHRIDHRATAIANDRKNKEGVRCASCLAGFSTKDRGVKNSGTLTVSSG
jgi:hypothetical protein